jgi:hypothetical protein
MLYQKPSLPLHTLLLQNASHTHTTTTTTTETETTTMRIVGHLAKEQIGKETQKPKNHLFCSIKTPHPKTKLTQKPNPDCFPPSKLHTPKKNSQIPAKITALLKPLLLLLSSSSSFLLLLLLLLEQNLKIKIKIMNNPPKINCLAYTQSSKKWSKIGALGGIWSKIGQEKRPTHYPQSEGEEERAEKERGEE